MITYTVKPIDWGKAIQGLAKGAQDKAELVLQKVGEAMMAWLASLGKEERGWETHTGLLAESYDFEVKPLRDGARLTMWNDAQRNGIYYAVILEQRDGKFVLHGVTDPGGPVEQRLVEVCAEFAPEWEVVRR